MSGTRTGSDDTAAAPRSGSSLRALLGGTLGVTVWAVVCLGLLVAGTVLAVLVRQAASQDDLRQQALSAARQEALNLTSVDGTDLEADLERVLEGATGDFREEFSKQSEELRDLLADNEVRAEGTVLEAGLLRFDSDSATALVVIDSRVSNTDIPDGQVRSYRMQLDLERVGNRWLTSTLQFVA